MGSALKILLPVAASRGKVAVVPSMHHMLGILQSYN
jgi:hypothetical protein